ncbi:MAG: cation:proton antiporter [Bdellovibrionia bacterium]
MEVFKVVIALLVGGALLAALARRIGAPYPALVALAGAVLALVPGVPTLVLDPELALTLFVAPVLVDAAFDASLRDLRSNWRPVTSLALGAVALTVAVAAIVAHALVPEMPWSAAIALGAIVAPPDAAAATAVLRQLRPPYRMLVILEGESLFNDASALLIYRLAVGATLVGTLSGWSILPTLLGVTLGSALLGIVLAWSILKVFARIHDMATAVILQFCCSFGVWTLAEQMHLSGIITCVVFAMSASRKSSEFMPARLRIQAWAVWEVAVFVLNVLAFVLVGFQLKLIVARASGHLGDYAIVAAAVCAAVILARMAWVTAAAGVVRWKHSTGRKKARTSDAVGLNPKSAAVVGWCGMRGTVTLAAALALPISFPQRDMVLATAFGVTLGTLVLQGLTLRPILLWLQLRDEGQVEHELLLARLEILRAAISAIATCPGAESSGHVRQTFEMQLSRAEKDFNGASLSQHKADYTSKNGEVSAALAAIEGQRRCLMALRTEGRIGDEAFHRIEEELDWMELGWEQALRFE